MKKFWAVYTIFRKYPIIIINVKIIINIIIIIIIIIVSIMIKAS